MTQYVPQSLSVEMRPAVVESVPPNWLIVVVDINNNRDLFTITVDDPSTAGKVGKGLSAIFQDSLMLDI
ncbi:MAG TPA: hypothetical protein VNT30_05215 [Stellaceae bacterium]|nr:hypothetical protein [Stellaceae bacterium]